MTLILIGKGLVLGGESPSKIEVIGVPGIHMSYMSPKVLVSLVSKRSMSTILKVFVC